MSSIQQGLLITAIGMGLVFAVIIFLWGLMALLMRLTSRVSSTDENVLEVAESDQPLVPEMAEVESQRKAAAAAVAVNLALASSDNLRGPRGFSDASDRLNPWVAVHRARQLHQPTKRG